MLFTVDISFITHCSTFDFHGNFTHYDFSSLLAEEVQLLRLDLRVRFRTQSQANILICCWRSFLDAFPWHRVREFDINKSHFTSYYTPGQIEDLANKMFPYLNHPYNFPPELYPRFPREWIVEENYTLDIDFCPVECILFREHFTDAMIQIPSMNEKTLSRLALLPNLKSLYICVDGEKPIGRIGHPTVTTLREHHADMTAYVKFTGRFLHRFTELCAWTDLPSLTTVKVDFVAHCSTSILKICMNWYSQYPGVTEVTCENGLCDTHQIQLKEWRTTRRCIQVLVCPNIHRQGECLVYMLPSDILRRILLPMLSRIEACYVS